MLSSRFIKIFIINIIILEMVDQVNYYLLTALLQIY